MGRLIDADALKETIEKERFSGWGNCCVEIDDAPTVGAEPVRHGKWVKMRGMMPPEYMGLKECSVCGWHINPIGRTAFDKHESEFCYCPHCGARMDEQFADPCKMVGDEDATN